MARDLGSTFVIRSRQVRLVAFSDFQYFYATSQQEAVRSCARNLSFPGAARIEPDPLALKSYLSNQTSTELAHGSRDKPVRRANEAGRLGCARSMPDLHRVWPISKHWATSSDWQQRAVFFRAREHTARLFS